MGVTLCDLSESSAPDRMRPALPRLTGIAVPGVNFAIRKLRKTANFANFAVVMPSGIGSRRCLR